MSGRAGDDVTTFEPSGVWYCRKHCGTVNEDDAHDENDTCPWYDGKFDPKTAMPLDPCDWIELLYEKAKANG